MQLDEANPMTEKSGKGIITYCRACEMVCPVGQGGEERIAYAKAPSKGSCGSGPALILVLTFIVISFG
jgi:hypothetical protein